MNLLKSFSLVILFSVLMSSFSKTLNISVGIFCPLAFSLDKASLMAISLFSGDSCSKSLQESPME